MKNKNRLISVAALLASLIVLCFLFVWNGDYGSLDNAREYLREEKPLASFFKKEWILKTEKGGECRYFRVNESDFEKLCKELEPYGWKAEYLFSSKRAGEVWILYGNNFPPFEVKRMKLHEKEAASEADRLILMYRLKAGFFLAAVGAVLLAAYYLYQRDRA